MSKIAFFLISSAPYLVDYYHLDFYKENNPVRLVLCIRKDLRESLSKKTAQVFDEIYDVNPADAKSYNTALDFSAVKNIIARELKNIRANTIRIFTCNEFNLPVAAKLRAFFNIQGHTVSELKRFSDKLTVKSELAKHNICVPRFTKFDQSYFVDDPVQHYQKLVKYIGSPFILKPINTSGSYGILKIESLKEFLTIGTILPLSQYIYEAEEYIDGDLYHCDAYFIDEKCILFNCSQYNYPLLMFSEGKNVGSIPLLQDSNTAQKLLNFHSNIYKALPPPDGIVHTEVFIADDGRCIFLENSLRAGGAYIIPMYESSFGVNLLSIDFSKQMGLKPYDNYANKEYCFWMSFPKLYGEVSGLLEPSVNSEYKLTWYVDIGEHLHLAKSMRDKAAAFISWNDTYDVLFNDFKYISQNSVLEML